MKKKILILGSTGLIGHQINFLLSSNPEYEIANIAYRNKLHEDTLLLDIMDEALLNSAIQEIKPEICEKNINNEFMKEFFAKSIL